MTLPVANKSFKVTQTCERTNARIRDCVDSLVAAKCVNYNKRLRMRDLNSVCYRSPSTVMYTKCSSPWVNCCGRVMNKLFSTPTNRELVSYTNALDSVFQMVDSSIHWINHYPLDSDLSIGELPKLPHPSAEKTSIWIDLISSRPTFNTYPLITLDNPVSSDSIYLHWIVIYPLASTIQPMNN